MNEELRVLRAIEKKIRNKKPLTKVEIEIYNGFCIENKVVGKNV